MKTDEIGLTLTSEFDAPRSLVFACWTDPVHMAKWFMPEDMTVLHSDTDVRVGGGFRTCLLSADGWEYRVRGEYREISPNSRLVFTHGWEDETGEVPHWTTCILDFEDLDGRTLLTFGQIEFETEESRNGHLVGWVSTFDNLVSYLETLPKSH